MLYCNIKHNQVVFLTFSETLIFRKLSEKVNKHLFKYCCCRYYHHIVYKLFLMTLNANNAAAGLTVM